MMQKLKIKISTWVFFIALLVYVLANVKSNAQYFTAGSDPASIKWSKFRTEHYTVIFPRSFEEKAQYIASGLEYFFYPGSRSLDATPRRFPLILHNQTVVSNAFVPYAPKRIEFLTVPPQDNPAQDWIDGLILHEFRHTVHYSSVNRGLTRGLSFVFGEQIVAGVLGLFVPLWFIEGDATVTETAFNHSGRGRVPSFEQKLRAQFIEKGIYNYDKAAHGSFRDFIPDRYELGYQLVGRTRVEFGTEVWANAMKKAGNLPVMVVPFSYSLKKQTGYGKVQLYKHITDRMKEEWLDQDRQTETTPFETLTPETKVYTNYTLPISLSDGRTIAIKSSLDDIDRIMLIRTDGKSKKLFTPGVRFQPHSLSASGNLICWGEIMADPRWDLRSYAVVKTYDISTGKIKQITRKTRYFAPAINRVGDRIVTVQVTRNNIYSLAILAAKDGTKLDSLGTAENYFFQQPAWSEDGERIVSVVAGREGKSLMLWEPSTDSVSLLIPFSFTEISSPSFYEDHVLFTGAYSGRDDIYALNLMSGEVLKVTTARFGATDARRDLHSDSILYADYTSDGYRIVRAAFEPSDWEEQNTDEIPEYPLAESLAQQEDFLYVKDSVPDRTYEVKKYRKGLNLFNFHSWAPININIDNMDVKPGITLLSQNLLSTSYTTLGWEYDLNEEAGKFTFNYNYEGLYPVFDIGLDHGLRRGIHEAENDSIIKFKYNELNAYGGIRVPLLWYKGSWYFGVSPRAGISFRYLKMDPDADLSFRHDRLLSSSYSLFFYGQQKRSYRDLQPRWGQSFQVGFNHSLLDSTLTDNAMYYAIGLFYLPGIVRHHGLSIYLGYYNRMVDYYRYSNPIRTPRGQSGIFSDEMATLSASYVFPIFYPDWRIGPVVYIKRLKGSLFYDHSLALDTDPYIHYNTVGLDLSMDFHFLSILAPLEIGLRSMYFPETGTFGFNFIWDINIDSLY